MSITEQLRQDLRAVIAHAEAGNTAEVVRTAQKALQELDGDRLLTTTEAAEALGVRSINTVKLWCRTGFLASVRRGNRTMIPLAEIERVRGSERVRAIRAADRLHDASAEFGVPEGLSDKEGDSLVRTITLDVPDDLADQLVQMRDRLPELLALSLQQPAVPAHRTVLFSPSSPAPRLPSKSPPSGRPPTYNNGSKS